MRVYRPRSFLHLVLLGFALVALPLIGAILYATLAVDRLTDRSQQAIYQAVQVMQQSRVLVEHTIAMERYVRQFQVLGDMALFDAYADTHEKVRQVTHNLAILVHDAAQEQLIERFTHEEQGLFETLIQHQRAPETALPLTGTFTTLADLAQEIVLANDASIAQETRQMQEMASTAQRTVVLLSLAVIPGAVLFSATFIGLISRPIRRLDQAIHRLGTGEFTAPIRLTGPQDLQALGQRLNWLRWRLLELEEEKLKFLRHVSHELKTPLTAMREGAALLAEEGIGALNQAQREVTGILQRNGLQLQKRIEDLLNFHLAQARNTAFDASPVLLEQLLEEVCSAHQLTMRVKSLQVEQVTTPVCVRGDAEKLRIALDNVLSNAVKFSPPGGTIRITLTRNADTATVDIGDHGPGITPHDKARVFEAFYQGTAVAPGQIQGSGLGLSIAREYIMAHHGTIAIVDDVASGAHFRITLPALAQ
jgi:two-component system, NtrC family, sensor histidine kinase GlrK